MNVYERHKSLVQYDIMCDVVVATLLTPVVFYVQHFNLFCDVVLPMSVMLVIFLFD